MQPNGRKAVALAAILAAVLAVGILPVALAAPALAEPVADAGADHAAAPGDTVTLDGSNSSGTGIAYSWEQDSGPAVTLDFISPAPVGKIADTDDIELKGAWGVATFTHSGTTYAAVSGDFDDGVQILSLADPANPEPVGRVLDNATLPLDGTTGITVFEHSGTTYAAAVSDIDHGGVIISLADPSDPEPVGIIHETINVGLGGARDIAAFEHSGTPYAAVALSRDHRVQILSLADPANPEPVGSIGNGAGVSLHGAHDIAIFEHSGATYAAVANWVGGSVQILSLADPASPEPAGSIAGADGFGLGGGAWGIAAFEHSGATYAVVTGDGQSEIVILSLADPANPEQVGKAADIDGFPIRTNSIAIFEDSGATYAAVTGSADGSVQILSLADPANPEQVGRIADTGGLELAGAWGIATFDVSGTPHAAVAAWADYGVQIISLADRAAPTFTAPRGPATLEFNLTVTDTAGRTAADSVTVTVSAAPAAEPEPHTVALEPPGPLGSRDIGTITLASSQPGTIDASWVGPTEDPADYRVSWAKTGESFKTWTDLTGNAFPTEPSHTITGLDEGEYKVMIRARYSGTPGDWSSPATITVAGAASPPQPDPRMVGAITLGSSVPGTIVASWAAPGETPVDYRVSWAKSGEPFKTWTDLAGNAFPTGTSHTISGLEEGEEYKVKIRARYGGTSGDWSSPVTTTVAGDP